MHQINRNQAEDIFNNSEVIKTKVNQFDNNLCLILDFSNGEHLQMNYKYPDGVKTYFLLDATTHKLSKFRAWLQHRKFCRVTAECRLGSILWLRGNSSLSGWFLEKPQPYCHTLRLSSHNPRSF